MEINIKGKTYVVEYSDGETPEWVEVTVYEKNNDFIVNDIERINVSFGYEVNKDAIDVDWEQGDATYVPYGSTNVLYDDGLEINDIDCSEAIELNESDAIITSLTEGNEDGEEISWNAFKEIFKEYTNKVWNSIVKEAEKIAIDDCNDYYWHNAIDLVNDRRHDYDYED